MNGTDRTRRVIVLNQYAKPRSEGGGTRHTELFERVRGWEHLIIAGNLDHASGQRYRTQDPHFALVPVSAYRGNDHRRVISCLTYCVTALWEALRGPRPDVVYASSPHIFGPVAGWLAARLRGARFVLEIRDLWPQSIIDTGHLRAGSLVHRGLRQLETWLYRRADRIVIVASGWRSYFQQRGIDDAIVEWVSNSAEPEDFDIRQDLIPLRDRCDAHGRLIVYAGAHGPTNGLDLLLDAAAELPEHTFALIGDGIEKQRLVHRARAEGLNNVRFLDVLPKRELAGILGGADIGVHVLADAAVFRLGLSPNKLYDYLAAGLPVVTNSPDEPHDIVMECGAGMAVGVGELAAGIRKLAGLDDATLREMGRQGREYIAKYRSRTVMSARLQRVLDEVTGG
ncbi:glycosyltransferase family 4 protein [Micromonospora inositola]|uniref:Glycosyltransferase involved in cell wall bisynthesis n=1 Tax=Micromonospora inositola TaxID=47865 RepID=A0A1C5K121_9ACTN|nr:glycosyltransferase family 4 protein [Micromonospora inositola]SCG76510.1 Glycosyltransferase involved in cell wall bisynthesis [Micromonospora inositola]